MTFVCKFIEKSMTIEGKIKNDDINESPLKSADILAIKSEQANIVRKELSKMLKKNAKLQKR